MVAGMVADASITRTFPLTRDPTRPKQMPDDTSPPRPDRRIRSARALAARLEQLARVLASQALAQGLNSAQWTALRYLATADEQTRHVGAFAAFHLTTA